MYKEPAIAIKKKKKQKNNISLYYVRHYNTL